MRRTSPLTTVRLWRPLLGGDEDRNHRLRRRVLGLVGGVPSSEGTRIATPDLQPEGPRAGPWRPLLGGDEDRNTITGLTGETTYSWRPLLGGDEDRNTSRWSC